jgi:hypothetical protein
MAVGGLFLDLGHAGLGITPEQEGVEVDIRRLFGRQVHVAAQVTPPMIS